MKEGEILYGYLIMEQQMKRSILTIFGILVLALTAGVYSPALGDDVNMFQSLSLEELLNLDVSTTSKRPENLAKVPGVVSVMTQEDIRNSGVRTLAEALNFITGTQVAETFFNQGPFI